MKRAIIITLIVLLLGTGAYAYYSQVYLPAQVIPAPTLNTTKVRTGDISITAAGIGTLMPSEKISIGFTLGGIVNSVTVKVGDKVTAGQVVAELDNLSLQVKLATDQVNFITAQQAVDDLVETLPSDLAAAQAALLTAESNLATATYNLNVYTNQRCSTDVVTLYNGSLITAQVKYDELLADYNSNYAFLSDYDDRKILAYSKLYSAKLILDTASANMAYCTGTSDTWTTEDLKAAVASAQAAYDASKAKVAVLKNGPDPDKQALAQAKLDQARLQLETTRADLKKTTLVAPISGTITSLTISKGQAVGTSPVMTIETLNKMVLRFFVDEADISLVQVGNPILVTFKAYPEMEVKGEVIYIEPVLQTIDGDLAVAGLATLAETGKISLLSGMSAEVEVISGEATKALLVPVQALRQLTPDSYAVFIVQPDGTIKLTPVTVGLKDFANAQILSGVKLGDVVSTGSVETK